MPRLLNKARDRIPDDAVYIGRPSKWGNKFEIGRHGTRDRVIDLYCDWIGQQDDLLADLHELRGRDLVCWCTPKRCHGHILLKMANEPEFR